MLWSTTYYPIAILQIHSWFFFQLFQFSYKRITRLEIEYCYVLHYTTSGSTGGSASTKAVFKVTVDANGTATISVLNSGGGSTPYSTGETITIPGTNSTYGTGNDITAKVTINPVGGLLKKTEISERFESPNPIRYDAFGATIPAGAPNAGTAVADTNTSGWRMRWGSQSITGWGSQSSNQLSFLYRDSETGREEYLYRCIWI